ncbi:hypothetical protein M885DRAFT_500345 [Pelagophyceae sp. CCMP2097]|nr:hypothetical protein M885DRAFT_500345 [Pelagophyceae sp. CCMP2097]
MADASEGEGALVQGFGAFRDAVHSRLDVSVESLVRVDASAIHAVINGALSLIVDRLQLLDQRVSDLAPSAAAGNAARESALNGAARRSLEDAARAPDAPQTDAADDAKASPRREAPAHQAPAHQAPAPAQLDAVSLRGEDGVDGDLRGVLRGEMESLAGTLGALDATQRDHGDRLAAFALDADRGEADRALNKETSATSNAELRATVAAVVSSLAAFRAELASPPGPATAGAAPAAAEEGGMLQMRFRVAFLEGQMKDAADREAANAAASAASGALQGAVDAAREAALRDRCEAHKLNLDASAASADRFADVDDRFAALERRMLEAVERRLDAPVHDPPRESVGLAPSSPLQRALLDRLVLGEARYEAKLALLNSSISQTASRLRVLAYNVSGAAVDLDLADDLEHPCTERAAAAAGAMDPSTLDGWRHAVDLDLGRALELGCPRLASDHPHVATDHPHVATDHVATDPDSVLSRVANLHFHFLRMQTAASNKLRDDSGGKEHFQVIKAFDAWTFAAAAAHDGRLFDILVHESMVAPHVAAVNSATMSASGGLQAVDWRSLATMCQRQGGACSGAFAQSNESTTAAGFFLDGLCYERLRHRNLLRDQLGGDQVRGFTEAETLQAIDDVVRCVGRAMKCLR